MSSLTTHFDSDLDTVRHKYQNAWNNGTEINVLIAKQHFHMAVAVKTGEMSLEFPTLIAMTLQDLHFERRLVTACPHLRV